MNSLENLIERINSIAGGVEFSVTRLRSLIDKIIGQLPPELGTDKVNPSPQPETLSQAVSQLQRELELLDAQFNRLENEAGGVLAGSTQASARPAFR